MTTTIPGVSHYLSEHIRPRRAKTLFKDKFWAILETSWSTKVSVTEQKFATTLISTPLNFVNLECIWTIYWTEAFFYATNYLQELLALTAKLCYL